MTDSRQLTGLLALAPILLGLVGGAAARWIEEAIPNPEQGAVAWDTGLLDAGILDRSADVDAYLAIEPPAAFASTDAWIAFGRSLKAIRTSDRFGNNGSIAPTLPWWVYIAMHAPDAIYALHDEKVVDDDQLGHLIQFGLAPDWAEKVEGADGLILSSGTALLDLAIARGAAHAQRRFIDLFLAEQVPANPYGAKLRVNLEGLRFALAAMTGSELEQVLPRLESGVFTMDPRGLSRLLLDARFAQRRSELLALIVRHAYSQRSMSSYLTDGALLGNEDHLRALLSDVADNAGQPTNFYCAACGLALASDGLLGAGLLDAIQSGAEIGIAREGSEFVLSGGRERRD